MVFTFSWTGRDSILDGPTFQISRPPRSFFSFPPSPYPNALPAPIDEGSLRSPFAIDATLYNKLLDGKVPLIFASIYILSVLSCNQINRRRGNKPWAISKTGLFYLFVILHNVALAVYSGITCYAMFFGLRNTLPPIFDAGVTGTVDALCKMHGPRGLGDAITYNTTTRAWAGHNRFIHLSDDGLTPDSTDVGRLWNEGLAFWGWFFYLSKFYEVVDTMIILLKGKRSATLQTYHHAGAMMCMWAGMRYMSPPIWMFVLVNSGIHTLMYTYYTLHELGIRVPKPIKQTLTTMQITQFLVGVTFAAAHLFVSYSIPISIPYTIASVVESIPHQVPARLVPSAASAASHVSTAAASLTFTSLASQISEKAAAATSHIGDKLSHESLSSMGSAVSSGASAASTAVSSAVASAMASGDAMAWFKKLAFRAAGLEGIAETVRNETGQVFEAVLPTAREIVYETHYEDAWETVHCLDTEGQAFAVWLNVVYLLPLTFLFLRFFVKTYFLGKPRKGSQAAQRRFSEDTLRAARKTSKSLERFGERLERSLGDLSEEMEDLHVEQSVGNLKKELRNTADGVLGRDSKEVLVELEQQGKATMESVIDEVKSIAGGVAESVKKELASLSESTGSVREEMASSKESLENSTVEVSSPNTPGGSNGSNGGKKKGHNKHHNHHHAKGGASVDQGTPSRIPVAEKATGGNVGKEEKGTGSRTNIA